MPFIQVTMLEGRTVEQKHALMKGITDAVVDALGNNPESIRVAIYEVSKEEWSVGGVPMSTLRP